MAINFPDASGLSDGYSEIIDQKLYTLTKISATEFYWTASQAENPDDRYVNRSGDTMTGPLTGITDVSASAVELQEGPTWTAGVGVPEGSVTAPVGSLFTRTDGSAGSTLYVKESGTGNTGWAAQVNNAVNSGTEVGTVAAFAANTPPAGWLECDGSSLVRTTYPDLFAAIGTLYGEGNSPGSTFNLPDLRGEFVRGWDNGRGIDTGRAFASFQLDEFKSHTHYGIQSQNIRGGDNGGVNSSNSTNSTPLFPAGGDETRPRNIAMLYCIKYVANDIGTIGATGPQGTIAPATGDILPSTDSLYSLGSSSLKWNNVFTNSVNLDGPTITTGTVTPEGNVTAELGSLYTDDDSGLFVKRSGGTGNTGWQHSGTPAIYAVFDASSTPGNGVLTEPNELYKNSGFASVTRTSAGRYTMVFDTAMSDENYLIQMTVEGGSTALATATAVTTTGFNIQIGTNNNGATNQTRCYITVYKV